MRRLRKKMADAADAVEAVAAWIDARLDLAFDEDIKSDLRRLSLEAQSQMFASPELDTTRVRRDARAAHRSSYSAASPRACFATSIR